MYAYLGTAQGKYVCMHTLALLTPSAVGESWAVELDPIPIWKSRGRTAHMPESQSGYANSYFLVALFGPGRQPLGGRLRGSKGAVRHCNMGTEPAGAGDVEGLEPDGRSPHAGPEIRGIKRIKRIKHIKRIKRIDTSNTSNTSIKHIRRIKLTKHIKHAEHSRT